MTTVARTQPDDDVEAAPPDPGPAPLPAGMKRSNLSFAVALPLFFMIMFPLCYITALHLPAPHDIPVAVVGAGAAAVIAQAGSALAGTVSLLPTGTPGQAVDMVLSQTVKAAYVPAPAGQPAELLVAGADGRVMTQLVPTILSPVATASGNTGLTVHDVAPLAPGDGNGIGLMFFMLIVSIVGFMTANILGNAAFFLDLRSRLAITGVVAVLTPVVLWLFMGPWLQILQGGPGQIAAVIALGALTNAIVGLTTHAAVVYLGKWALFPCMLLFVFLNIPSSNSAYPAEIVPPLFGWISQWHLGAAMVDSVRSVLYLHGAGLGGHLVTIAVWAVLAIAFVASAALYRRRRGETGQSLASVLRERDDDTDDEAEAHDAAEHRADAAAAGAGPGRVLEGRVHDHAGSALPRAVVTVVDRGGAQTGRVEVGDGGRFRVTDLGHGPHTLIATAPGHRPTARTTVLEGGGDDLGTLRLTPHDRRSRDDGTPAAPPAAAAYGG